MGTEDTYGTLLLPAAAANINFTGGGSFSHGKHIVSWFDLETCSKVIEDGANGHNAYDFLLLFYSNFGRISYHFCATVDFTPK